MSAPSVLLLLGEAGGGEGTAADPASELERSLRRDVEAWLAVGPLTAAQVWALHGWAEDAATRIVQRRRAHPGGGVVGAVASGGRDDPRAEPMRIESVCRSDTAHRTALSRAPQLGLAAVAML